MLQSHLGTVVLLSLRNNCTNHITLYVHFSACGNPYSLLYFCKYDVFALVLFFEIQFFMLRKRIFKSWLVSFIIHHFNIRSLATEMFKRLNLKFSFWCTEHGQFSGFPYRIGMQYFSH